MAVRKVRRGLDLPIAGSPEQAIHDGPLVTTVGLVAADYIGLKPQILCQIGQQVKRGSALFADRRIAGVHFTSPGAGEVIAINRGERRALESIVVALSAAEQAGQGDQEVFAAYTGKPPAQLNRDEIVALLAESGLWAALRERPFSRVPTTGDTPAALFVTAIDTRPLAPSVDVALRGREEDFQVGLAAVSKLAPRTWLCKAPGSAGTATAPGVTVAEFAGPHPAGLPGTHIHMLDPVSRKKSAWYLDYQDVIAIGRLFATGQLDTSRVISLAGPPVRQPRLLRTRQGAALDALTAGELVAPSPGGADDLRVISGDVLAGRAAAGERLGYLGRYHLQVSALEEGREREFIGWMLPGQQKFSITWSYLGSLFGQLLPARAFQFTTSTHGEERAMVPIGVYERVMPLDILPTFLLRALTIGDVERAEKLGALELDEEDLGLCTFVCPGKQDYGPQLRAVLSQILKEG